MQVLKVAVMSGALAMGALGLTGVAQARDDVYWSLGIGAPGAVLGMSNVPPVYAQPVYVEPAPVIVRPRPVYVQPEYYGQPVVVYRPYRHWDRHEWREHHGWGWHRHHDDDDD